MGARPVLGLEPKRVHIPTSPYRSGFKTLISSLSHTDFVPEKGSGRWQALLAQDDVRRWYENLARGSQATADNYVRVLGRFLEAHALTPASLVSMKPKARDDLVSDHVSQLVKAGKAGTYIAVHKKVVVS